MATAQVEYTYDELLESHPIAEPLFAGGVRCHGGFDESGSYVSPRTKNRWPAIRAWQEQREAQFGTPLLDIALSTWPEAYPNVEQSKFLLREGVRDPIAARLTQIGTVEGFGSMIRYSTIPELQQCFDEDVSGTAMAHLGRGLYEAHARDEAGHGDEGGHKQMWYAARDVAFEGYASEDMTSVMLARMFGDASPGNGGGAPDAEAIRKAMLAYRLHDDVDFSLEMLIERMARLLLIEISAYHVFAWAEELLSDTELVAGDGEAARLVSYIRADEAPHVEYLKTTLSEMRDRTFIGESGRKHPGTDIVGAIWDRAREESLGVRREQNLNVSLREVEHALEAHPRGDDVLEQFHALGSVRPSGDTWVDAQPGGY